MRNIISSEKSVNLSLAFCSQRSSVSLLRLNNHTKHIFNLNKTDIAFLNLSHLIKQNKQSVIPFLQENKKKTLGTYAGCKVAIPGLNSGFSCCLGGMPGSMEMISFKQGTVSFKQETISFKPGDTPFKPGIIPIKHGVAPIKPGASPFKQGELPFKTGKAPIAMGMPPVKQGASPNKQGAIPDKQGGSPGKQGGLRREQVFVEILMKSFNK